MPIKNGKNSNQHYKTDKNRSLDYIKEVEKKVSVDEGEIIIEKFLLTIYFNNPISNKELARILLLPIPLVTAIKKEYIKLGLLRQHNGITITAKGIEYVESVLGYKGLNKSLYLALKEKDCNIEKIFKEEIDLLGDIFAERPNADVSIDQAHCTYMTSIKRSLLCLNHNSLINKKILCVGDDDLVSISIGFLLKKLLSKTHCCKTEIHVIDLDQRYLDYIESISIKYDLPIICHNRNLKDPMSKELIGIFDCFFTDPPYTQNGMSLFLSRGISGLKMKKGLPIFLSFAHRSFNESFEILQEFVRMGLCVNRIIPNYNLYEGGSIIGNISQLIILNTTQYTSPCIKSKEYYQELIYTREVKKGCSIRKNAKREVKETQGLKYASTKK